MNNKKGIIIGAIASLIVVIVAIVLIFVQKVPVVKNEVSNNQEVKQVFSKPVEEMTVAEIEAIPTTEENMFVIKEDGSFSPKQMTAKYGERLWATIKAEGAGKYIIASETPGMAELLLVMVDGSEEAKSIAFPVPEPGEYTFYVASTENPSDRSNTGTITVVK